MNDKDYKIGYGKPPKSGQFKKGQSGNPKGRPKGKRNGRIAIKAPDSELAKIILDEGKRTMKVMENGVTVDLPVIRIIVRSAMHNAMKGQANAQRTILTLYRAAETFNNLELEERTKTILKLKHEGEKEIARRQRYGIENGSPIIPHPDNIVVDESAGTIDIYGPLDLEEHNQLNTIQKLYNMHADSLPKHKQELADATDAFSVEYFESEIAHSENIIEAYGSYIDLMKRPRTVSDEIKSMAKALSIAEALDQKNKA